MNNASQEYAEYKIEFDDSFGHWLAGFIAGEGSLVITKINKEKGYVCRLVVQVRDDDAPIIEEIQQKTKLGYLCPHKPRGNINPGITWNVSKKQDVVNLLTILDKFPLRAKKQKDYEIWREAVVEWTKVKGGQKYDWSKMSELKEELQNSRKYVLKNVGSARRGS